MHELMEYARYFPHLPEIPHPPQKLYANGTLPAERTVFLTVVGSRKFTSYGKMACEQLLSGLAGYPVSIVSGLALGIDTIAHTTALEVGLHTIAIPGSGLGERVLYPATNRGLARMIVERGGLLLSEFEPDFRATQWSFPQRNRLMAGLAHAVLVIEAEERSGTRITARMAADYNKDVLAVPGSIFSTASSGTNALIAQGAIPVMKSTDILQALHLDEQETEESPGQTAVLHECSPNERIIIDVLKEPLERDVLARNLPFTIEDTTSLLTILEIKGLIKESGGKLYRTI